MEHQSNRTHHYRNKNNHVLPVILYLTLPAVNVHQDFRNDNNRNVKHQKRKQRDFQRMKHFNEQKTVCSMFPFYELKNDEIQNMVTRPAPVNFIPANSRLEKTKMFKLQEENEKLNLLNMELKEQLRTMDEKLVCQNLEFQYKIDEKEKEINNLLTECSRLHSKLHHEQYSREEIEAEYLAFKEHTENAAEKQMEHFNNIRKHNPQEINELKNKIEQLKMELQNPVSKPSNIEHESGTTNTHIKKQPGVHQGVCTCGRVKSSGNSQPKPTPEGNSQFPGCQKCGSTVPHQPQQCPARNFVCECCRKRGHHTINCIHACRGCGAKKTICNKQENCCATYLNCAYCNVRGHLLHVCLKRRLDQLGY